MSHSFAADLFGYENEFRVGMGAEAIKELLAAINVDELAESLKEELKNTTSQKKARIIKRLEVIGSRAISLGRPH